MKPENEPEDFFDKPQNIKLILRVFYVLCALLVIIDFFVARHPHDPHPWEMIPAFYAIYGFVACVILVLVATQMRKLLMRDENYYDTDDLGDNLGGAKGDHNAH